MAFLMGKLNYLFKKRKYPHWISCFRPGAKTSDKGSDSHAIKQLSAPIMISNFLNDDSQSKGKEVKSMFDLKREDISVKKISV